MLTPDRAAMLAMSMYAVWLLFDDNRQRARHPVLLSLATGASGAALHRIDFVPPVFALPPPFSVVNTDLIRSCAVAGVCFIVGSLTVWILDGMAALAVWLFVHRRPTEPPSPRVVQPPVDDLLREPGVGGTRPAETPPWGTPDGKATRSPRSTP